MDVTPTPTGLAKAAGISVSYASQILGGTRNASTEVALIAFRIFGLRLGLLAEMTEADIQKLCDERCHNEASTPAPAPPAIGKSGDLTSAAAPQGANA